MPTTRFENTEPLFCQDGLLTTKLLDVAKKIKLCIDIISIRLKTFSPSYGK